MTSQKQRKPKTVFTLDQKFDIPLSTYYDCINRPEFTEEEVKIMNNIIKISSETYHTYGSRRMRDTLNDDGIKIGRFKTRRLMKAADIKVVYPKKKHRYPPDELSNKAPELLNRQFNPATLNTYWVGDITYISNTPWMELLGLCVRFGNERGCWLCFI